MNPKKNIFSVTSCAYIALFVALLAVCAWISIPFTVPFTLQTFAVFAAAGLLGWKRGTVAVCVYLLLGALGLPVFSGFNGGAGALLGTTGGYLIGFVASVLAAGAIMDRFGRSMPAMLIAMVAGLILCYAFGTIWFINVYTKTKGAVGVMTALSWCVFPFLIPDAAKIVLAAVVTKRLYRHVSLNTVEDSHKAAA